ncbi:hypothetical protein MPLB_1490036 [Mesorhizobium sp. ORS 3324]|nr:hypothetical protein MPLB_1490036 [Mesorhizobium sp. ORS 3324]
MADAKNAFAEEAERAPPSRHLKGRPQTLTGQNMHLLRVSMWVTCDFGQPELDRSKSTLEGLE